MSKSARIADEVKPILTEYHNTFLCESVMVSLLKHLMKWVKENMFLKKDIIKLISE